jgi:predicted dehydrogenase
VAVVGCGGIGRMHLLAFKDLPRARLVALSSRRAERAREVAKEMGCEATDDPVALVRRPDVDVVSITTSSGSHAALALAAIDAGKHVVVEKPMAMTVDDAQKIIDTARARGVVLSVVSQRRFEPTHQRIKRLLDEGALGKLLLVEASCPYYRTQEYYASAEWRGTLADDGGALMNQSIHSVDLMLWLGGPAIEVYGHTATQTHKMEAEDMAVAVLRFASGALGSIMASTSIRPGFQPSLGLYGEKGTIKMEGAAVAHWTVPGAEPPVGEAQASTGITSPQLASHEHHRAQMADVLEAIDAGRSPLVTGQDGLRAVEFVTGVYRASLTGKPVRLTA